MTSSSGGIDWVEWTPTFDGSKTSKPVVVRTIARPPKAPMHPLAMAMKLIAVVVTGMNAYSMATSTTGVFSTTATVDPYLFFIYWLGALQCVTWMIDRYGVETM